MYQTNFAYPAFAKRF